MKLLIIVTVGFAYAYCQPLQFPPQYSRPYSHPLYPAVPDYGTYVGPPLQNPGLLYNPDAKWPAYGMDAPGNYQQLGKYNNNGYFNAPPGMPRWYAQPIGGGFFKHNPFFDWNPYILSGSVPTGSGLGYNPLGIGQTNVDPRYKECRYHNNELLVSKEYYRLAI